MSDPSDKSALQREESRPDPAAQEKAEGGRDVRREQDRGKGPGMDTSDRPPAEGARDIEE